MTLKSKVHPLTAQEDQPASSLISDKTLLSIYTSMLRCQLLRKRLPSLSRKRQGMSGPVPEHAAILAALTVDLKERDILSLPASDAAAGFLKGQPLSSILQSEPFRREASHLHSVPPAGLLAGNVVPAVRSTPAQLYLACGLALARAQTARESVVAAFCAGAPIESSCWREVLTLASRHRLPMIFMIYETSRKVGQFDAMARSARVHGVPLLTTDSQDAVALYRVVYESLNRARKSQGPTLVSCRTDVLSTATRGTRALHRMELYLRRKGILNTQLREQLTGRFLLALQDASKDSNVSAQV